MALRFDKAGRLGKVTRTPQGGINVRAGLTRSGVLVYTTPDGSKRREWRPEEEVFSEASMASLAGAPVTLGHPPLDKYPGGFVNPENFRDLARGYGGKAERADSLLETDLALQERELINVVESRKATQVSCGYRCRLDHTPGVTPQGEAYDAVQRDIVYNHIAIVEKGRAGAEASLRLDASDDELPDQGDPRKGEQMETIRIDGVDYPMTSEAERKAASLAMQRYDAKVAASAAETQKKLDAQTARADAAEATNAETQKKLDSASDTSRFDAAVKARVALLAFASKSLGTTIKRDNAEIAIEAASETEIQSAIIAKAFPALSLEGKSAEYISALYEGAKSLVTKQDAADTSGVRSIRDALNTQIKQDAATEDDGRTKMIKENREAYKKPGVLTK